MGCVVSRTIDNDERVQIYEKRWRLMKQLLEFRSEFSDALSSYLRSLKNTGMALRQFTESETLEIEDIPPNSLTSSPSSRLPLPPPPPPPFSPNIKSKAHELEHETGLEESVMIDDDDDDGDTFLPPPHPSSSWESWGPFEPLSIKNLDKRAEHGMDEVQWAEIRTEFEEECAEEIVEENTPEPLPEKLQKQHVEMDVDGSSSSALIWSKEPSDMMMMMMATWRTNKTLESIVKDLDDYFLKASALGNEISILMDINSGDAFAPQTLRKRSNSAKVFSALSWSWSSKSLQLTQEASIANSSPSEPLRPGAHSITLEKIFSAEQKLHKEVKEEETAKLEHERKSLLLQKQEDEVSEGTALDRTRIIVENLQSKIAILQQSIGLTCSSILSLVDEELYPQLVILTSGLIHMWKTMYECHQVQNHISLQLNHISLDHITELTSDYHRRAALQLEAEVKSWHHSFCYLVKSQMDYVKTLCIWVRLTDTFIDEQNRCNFSSTLHSLCEQWLHHLKRIPHQVASEAIKKLLSAVQLIILQQTQEQDLQKRSDKLEKRLQKEQYLLNEMEKKLEGGGSNAASGANSEALSPNNPLSLKRAKVETLKKQAKDEKAKHHNSVHRTKVMVLDNLKADLPNAFQALMGFSSASAKALDAIYSLDKPTEGSQE
ncbi:hypothetical protein SAY87_000764 [Trapa incisa]|uniref:Uncharacterized protein n=1 Tax=Trapa incisa TaxID=236973 RepID=A0AAN7JHC5_9MYRT|nr:hypothetical protein SAY87_000764 [Trapa incisa]